MNSYHAHTTLAEIRAQGPCPEGWTKLLKHLGKTGADDEPLHLLTILESNGLDDALWCLRVPSLDRLSRHFQAWCAEQVLHLFEAKQPVDERVRNQIAMLRLDDATDDDRAAARDAARDAVSDAARAAGRDAARAAARDAARDAARAAARASASVAAWAAASVAARASARASASVAAWDAAWGAQERQLRAMIGGAE